MIRWLFSGNQKDHLKKKNPTTTRKHRETNRTKTTHTHIPTYIPTYIRTYVRTFLVGRAERQWRPPGGRLLDGLGLHWLHRPLAQGMRGRMPLDAAGCRWMPLDANGFHGT